MLVQQPTHLESEKIMDSSILITFLLLIIGFVLLVKGADFFVDGSVSVAARLRVPTLIIGMTIVAMGTSLPECSVTITASLNDQNSLAISNAIGSNLFNLMAICGICSIFSPLKVSRETLKKDLPLSIICALLLLGMGFWHQNITRIDGIILLVVFILFLIYMVTSAMKARTNASEPETTELIPVWKSILFIMLGAAAIAYGGDLVVDSASTIATKFGMSPTLVGLTICAIGTSLPELVTSIVAARKNQADMALGNVIGSNIFNILFVLGIGGSISPIAFITENMIDITVLIVMSLIVWLFAWTKNKIERKEGIFMVLMYAGYWAYICIR